MLESKNCNATLGGLPGVEKLAIAAPNAKLYGKPRAYPDIGLYELGHQSLDQTKGWTRSI